MHRILFAADFSNHDRRAFEQACRFAQAWNGKLLIAHVDDPHEDAADDHAASKKELARLIPADLTIDYQHILRTGDPAHMILDLEKEHDVDLIVLGTHARRGVKRLFIGSVAESVIRSAQCPVLTQRLERENTSHRQPTPDAQPKLLVPIDFSVHSYAALDFASSIAAAFGGEITVLHVDDSTDDSSEKIREGISQWSEHRRRLWDQLNKVAPLQNDIKFSHKLLNSPATIHIAQYAREEGSDYIVLGTHGRTGVGRALMGSVAEYIVRHVDCPVITVKPSNKLNPDLYHWKLAHHHPPV